MESLLYVSSSSFNRGIIAGLTDKLNYLFKGYCLRNELQFFFKGNRKVLASIVSCSNNKVADLSNKFNFSLIGYEGTFSWQVLGNKLTSPGINLNLAVLIHNLKKYRDYLSKLGEKPEIALINVDSLHGDLIAKVFAFLVGEITVTGKDKEYLKLISKAIFTESGIFVKVGNDHDLSRKKLVLDVELLTSYVGQMNFSGNYYCINGVAYNNFIFPAPLVESLLLCAKLPSQSYDPHIVSGENVTLIAKVAKSYNFLPVFSTTQNNFFEHNNDTQDNKLILP